MSTNDNQAKYHELKEKYSNKVIGDGTLNDLFYWSDITGIEVNSTDKPQYEYGVVVQHYVVSYEESGYSDSFEVTLERKPYKAEEQQFGWGED